MSDFNVQIQTKQFGIKSIPIVLYVRLKNIHYFYIVSIKACIFSPAQKFLFFKINVGRI